MTAAQQRGATPTGHERLMTPAFAAFSAGVPAAERGVVVGTASLFVDVAFGLSPALLGLLAQSTGYPPTFLVSGVIAAIGAAWLLIRQPGRLAPVPA